jgi:hypothetical protein
MMPLEDRTLELAAFAMAVVRIALDGFDAEAKHGSNWHSDRCDCPICFHVGELRRLVGHGLPVDCDRVAPAIFWQRVTELHTDMTVCARAARELVEELKEPLCDGCDEACSDCNGRGRMHS